ncbi:MAG: dihydroorotase [Thermoplasmataceae archaeon]|jgi:dihydroorotase
MFDEVYSGKFYINGDFRQVMIGVEDGRIAKISKVITGQKVVELGGSVLPGSTDIHVHFRDPGETDKEDFESGSISALYGGTTTVFDMPNNSIPIQDYDSYQNKLAAVRNRSYVDFGLYSLFNGKNFDVLDSQSAGFKVFLGGSTNSVVMTEYNKKDMESLISTGKPVIFHAEDQKCLDSHKMDERTLLDHNNARPEICEATAIEEMVKYSIPKAVVAHVSSVNSLEGYSGKLTEVTPHHLLLNDEMDLGSWGKVNPPLRSKETQSRLLQNYLDGHFSIVSSDHAPHLEEDKEDFQYAKSGIIGVETRVPLLLSLVHRKILRLEVFVKTALENPPEIFGLKKGKIDLGYSADFIAIDFAAESRINQERLHSKVPITPFHGRYAVFPSDVVLSGEVAVEKHEIIMDKLGKYIPFRNRGTPG